MADCTKQFKRLDEINTQLAELEGQQTGLDKPVALNRLLKEQRQAEEALRICLNQPVHGTVFPRYLVIALLYNPPGIGSEVSYGASSTAGITTDVTRSFKSGLELSASGKFFGNGIEVSVAGAGGVKNGRSFEINKEQGSSIGLVSHIDGVDHSKDVFFIWTNVRVGIDQARDGALDVTMGLSGDGQVMDVVLLTVAELRDQNLIPGDKKKKLAGLTPKDFQNILSLHPLIATKTIDPRRFRHIGRTLQLSGPDHPDDSSPVFGIELTDERAEGVISGTSKELTVGLTFEAGFNLFGVIAKVGKTFEWAYETSSNVTTGKKEEATVKLLTDTLEYHDVFDVYQDTMFRTFAFVSKTGRLARGSEVISGAVTNLAHIPITNQRVDVIEANGRIHSTVTNAQGIYRIFAIPEGKLRIEVGEVAKEITLVSDQAIELPFQISGDNPSSREPYRPKPKPYKKGPSRKSG